MKFAHRQYDPERRALIDAARAEGKPGLPHVIIPCSKAHPDSTCETYEAWLAQMEGGDD